jgi:hypothetical protein
MAEGSSSGVGYAKTAQPARPPPSAFFQPQKAKETLSAVTDIPGQDKLMIFASEWVFKPEGVKAVKTRFERVLLEHGLVCRSLLFLHVLVHLALGPLELVHDADPIFVRVRRWSNRAEYNVLSVEILHPRKFALKVTLSGSPSTLAQLPDVALRKTPSIGRRLSDLLYKRYR